MHFKASYRPSTQDIIKYLDKNLILSCPVTRQDILRADNIFGPSMESITGKPLMLRKKCRDIYTRHSIR